MTGLNCQLPLSFPLSPPKIPAWRTVKDKRALSLWHKLFSGWMPSRICAILDTEFRLRRVSSGVCQAVWIRIVLKLHHWNIFLPPVERYREVRCIPECKLSDHWPFIYFTFFSPFFDNDCRASQADSYLVEWVYHSTRLERVLESSRYLKLSG